MASPHFLLVTSTAWGLCKPQIILALHLLRRNSSLQITLLLPAYRQTTIDQLLDEFPQGLASDRLRMRYYGKGIVLPGPHSPLARIEASFSELSAIATEIFGGGESPTESHVESWDHPKVVIVDLMIDYPPERSLVQVIRETCSGADRPAPTVLCFEAYNGAAFAWLHLKQMSPFPSLLLEYRDEVNKGGEPKAVYDKLMATNDSIINIPPGAPMHIYEVSPNIPAWFAFDLQLRHDQYHQFDGHIINWPAGLSKQVVSAAQKQMGHYYSVGYLDTPGSETEASPLQNVDISTTARDDSLMYLDKMMSERGVRSVLLISFGTVFFPLDQERVRLLMETLVEQRIAYIFVLGQAKAAHADIIRSIVGSSQGLVVDWIPQKTVLEHPALAWFLTHGGVGSFYEALMAQVPMIMWPGSLDQPWVANEMSTHYNCAFEVVAARLGHHIGRRAARGIDVDGSPQSIRKELRDIFAESMSDGPQATEIRRNLTNLRDRVLRDAAPGGSSWAAMEQLANL